ncbi:MAG: hypothetical protein K2K57_01110 [Oscillospiraceae bacterium]|nr:hypothetical protein [Oscillospiraceae bacterium]
MDEEYEGKILVFSPSGFILKLIFAVGLTIVMGGQLAEGMEARGGMAYVVFGYALDFVALWFIATLFGFSLRATGNYIIAVILMFILLVAASAGFSWISAKNPTLASICGIGFLLLLIWLPINDIRKAILYIKNTI